MNKLFSLVTTVQIAACYLGAIIVMFSYLAVQQIGFQVERCFNKFYSRLILWVVSVPPYTF